MKKLLLVEVIVLGLVCLVAKAKGAHNEPQITDSLAKLFHLDTQVAIGGLADVGTQTTSLLDQPGDELQCSDQLVASLIEANKAGLRLSSDKQNLTEAHLRRTLIVCSHYIVEKITGKLLSSRPGAKNNLSMLARSLAPSMWRWPFFQGDTPKMNDIGALAQFIREMSGEYNVGPVANFINSLAPKASSDHLVRIHLLEPCREWNSSVGSLFEGAKAIKEMENVHYIFEERQMAHFEALNYTNNVCHFVLNMSKDDQRYLMSQI